MAAGVGIAAATAASAGAGVGNQAISGSATWSVATAEPGQTVTLSGTYQNDTPGPATFAIQLNVAGAASEVDLLVHPEWQPRRVRVGRREHHHVLVEPTHPGPDRHHHGHRGRPVGSGRPGLAG